MKQLVLLALVACGSHDAAAPAPGPAIQWKIDDARTAIKSATFDRRATKELDVPFDKLGVKLHLHVELAIATFSEAGAALRVPTVTALTATISDAGGYTLSRGDCAGPYYDPTKAPDNAILHCGMQARRGDAHDVVTFEVDGFAAVLVEGNAQRVIKPE